MPLLKRRRSTGFARKHLVSELEQQQCRSIDAVCFLAEVSFVAFMSRRNCVWQSILSSFWVTGTASCSTPWQLREDLAKCSWCGVTGVPLMVVHVSSGDAIDIIAAAPRRGVT